jgi:hypothetical protein
MVLEIWLVQALPPLFKVQERLSQPVATMSRVVVLPCVEDLSEPFLLVAWLQDHLSRVP